MDPLKYYSFLYVAGLVIGTFVVNPFLEADAQRKGEDFGSSDRYALSVFSLIWPISLSIFLGRSIIVSLKRFGFWIGAMVVQSYFGMVRFATWFLSLRDPKPVSINEARSDYRNITFD